MEGSRWEAMESDCLVNIFGRLGVDDLALGVPFVCKSWYRASHNPLCRRVLDFGNLDFMPWSIFAKRFIALYSLPQFSFRGFVRLVVGWTDGSDMALELRFPLRFRVLPEDMEYVASKCPGLKMLAWPRLFSGDDECIPGFLAKWKELEQFEMASKPYCFPKLARQLSLSCKLPLRTLRMSGSIKPEDASAIVDFLPKLKCLDLSKSYIKKEQLLAILDGCKELEWLSVRDCFGFQANEEILQRASGIKTFDLEGSKLMIDECGYETDDSDHVDVIF